MYFGVPAVCISLQVKINFRSPRAYNDDHAYYIHPGGIVYGDSGDVDWDSCGRSSPSTDGKHSACYVFSDGDVGNGGAVNWGTCGNK